MTQHQIPLPPGISRRDFMTFVAASTNNIPGAMIALSRRAVAEGEPMDDAHARAIVAGIRAWAVTELARMMGAPCNAVTADVVQR